MLREPSYLNDGGAIDLYWSVMSLHKELNVVRSSQNTRTRLRPTVQTLARDVFPAPRSPKITT